MLARMDGSRNVSVRNRQFLRKFKGVSDFLAAEQDPQGVGELSHRLGASPVVQGRQGAGEVPGSGQGGQYDIPGASDVPVAGLGGQYDVPANQSNKGDRGKGAGNELGAGLGGQYEVPSAPAREAGPMPEGTGRVSCPRATLVSKAREENASETERF